jgi:hypothetical protein
MRQSLGVLVVKARRQAVQDGHGREVLAGDHLQALALPVLLLPDELEADLMNQFWPECTDKT